jgi:uncharacterized membrane protein
MKKLKRTNYSFYLSLFFLLQLIGCGFRHQKAQPAETNLNGENQVSLETKMTYKQIQEKVIAPKCLRCHSSSGGNSGGVNLETLELLSKYGPKINQVALVNQTMPPEHPLSSVEQGMLKNYLSNQVIIPVTIPATNPEVKVGLKWSRIKSEILEKHCLVCHSTEGMQAAGLDLSSLNAVREKAELIFKRAIIQKDMPLQPYPPLNDEERKLLVDWMMDGMQEDQAP